MTTGNGKISSPSKNKFSLIVIIINGYPAPIMQGIIVYNSSEKIYRKREKITLFLVLYNLLHVLAIEFVI